MHCHRALLLLPLVVGCYPATGTPPGPLSLTAAAAATARWPDATPERLESGRQLFLAKCNNCHGYPDLGKVEQEDWPAIVKRMSHKAHLEDEQRELVLRFILTESDNLTSSGTP